MSVKGLWGKPRQLVTDATRRLIETIEANQAESNGTGKKTKFILMGTEGVPNPAGGDDPRTRLERSVLFMLRYLLPPHSDNETAAQYIHTKRGNPRLEWTVIRPTDLIDGAVSKYALFPKPQGSLFGGADKATRANVAKSIVDMILSEKLWEEWKYKMPYIQDLN
jgi:hypothetical protein